MHVPLGVREATVMNEQPESSVRVMSARVKSARFASGRRERRSFTGESQRRLGVQGSIFGARSVQLWAHNANLRILPRAPGLAPQPPGHLFR